MKYVLVVFLYEDSKGSDRQNSLFHRVDDIPDIVRNALVYVEKSVSFQGNLMLGILWPRDVYKFHMQEDPPQHLLKTYEHNGTKVRGILREPSHGRPIGTIELIQSSSDTVKKTTTAAASASSARGEESTNELYSALASRAGMAVSVVGKKDDEHAEALGIALKPTKNSGDDEVSEFLDDLWGFSPLGGLVSGAPKRKSSSSTPTKGASGAASADITGSGSPGPEAKRTQRRDATRSGAVGADAAVRSHQIGLSETVVFTCGLQMQDLLNPDTVMKQTTKKIEALLKTIKGRMVDKVMEHYAADYGWGCKSNVVTR